MKKLSKRMKVIADSIDKGKIYIPEEAFDALKTSSKVKFKESIDVAIRLGIDPRKSDQNVRGASKLPNGTGKKVTVAVFTNNADVAIKAGADAAGLEELIEKAKKGDFNFDVVIATPEVMRFVGKIGQVLGPKGLMPNPKDGTVSANVEAAVKNAKSGQVRFRNDKAGVIHSSIGKTNFDTKHLLENLKTLFQDVIKLKPSGTKGEYIKKVTVSSTMGPGLIVDFATLKG